MKRVIYAILHLFLIISISKADMTNYCNLPPSISSQISPNIMLVLQDDGRMRWRAYYPENFDNTKIYDGYFKPDALYKWNDGEKYWEETTTGTAATCPNRTDYRPFVYSQTLTKGSTTYDLDYAVIPKSVRIYSGNLAGAYDDGYGNLYNKDGGWIGSIVYNDSLTGKGKITFSSSLSEDTTIYYGYNLPTNQVYSGSCLNYHFMTRIDIVRYLLTGGSPKSCVTNQFDSLSNVDNCDPRTAYSDFRDANNILLKTQDMEDWDSRWTYGCFGLNDGNQCMKRYYLFPGITMKADKNRVYSSILFKQIDLKNKGKPIPRFGLITYDTASPVIHPNKVYIGDFRKDISDYDKDKEYHNLIISLNANRDVIPNIPADPVKTAGIWDAGNSLAPALWDVYRYFKQTNPLYGGLAPSSSTDDKWKNPYYQCVEYSGSKCSKVAPASCAKNFVILLTEGMWNIGSDISGDLKKTCNIDDGYLDYSSDPVVPIYKMRKELNIDTVYVLNVWSSYVQGKNASKTMAVFGSFDISNDYPEGFNGFPSQTCDLSSINSGLSNCKGSLCQSTLPDSKNNKYSWDINKDGIPDSYFEANNVDELKNALSAVVNQIQNKVSSSSTVAVLTGGKGDNGAILEQVLFYPEKRINGYKLNWISQMITLWYYKSISASNIREDTNENFKLDIQEDNAVSYTTDDYGNLIIKICSINPDGSTNTSSCQTYYEDIDKIKYLFDVGWKLKDRNYDDRKIYSIDKDGNFKLFTSSNALSFARLLGINPLEFPSCLIGSNGNIKYGDLIDYILGKQITGCRNRQADDNGDTWKLADIMNSSPRIVHYDNYDVVYVASNDGILHAFKLGKYQSLNQTDQVAELANDSLLSDTRGKELWGFIPKNALPYLRYLADPSYCHIYLNDLTPYIFNSLSGKKILIGGFRLGGGCGYRCIGDQNSCSNPVNPPSDTCPNPSSSSCVGLSSYYALDITDPENPKFLWEFTDKDLGFAYSGPGLIRTKENGVDKEYVIFASGMHNYSAQFASNENDRKLKIYVLDSNTGQLKRTIDTGIQKAFGGRIFSEGLDFDGDGYTDYIAFGYTQQSGSNTNFKGGIILLGGGKQGNNVYPFKNASSVSNWDFVNYTSLGTDINPVTTKVEFMKCFDRWYIYFGTGRWFKKDDDWEVNRNTLFGVPFDIKSDKNGQYIDFLTGTQDVTDESHVSNICTEASNNVIRGWYINLDPADSNSLKEKNISDPVVTTQNLVIFTTIKPNNDLCGFGGNTRVWTLNCATGGKPSGCPGGLYQVSNTGGTLLLQLSGGNIQEVNVANISGRVSGWYKGTPPEGASPFIASPSVSNNTGGRFILWIEK